MLEFDAHWAKPIINYLGRLNIQEIDFGMQCVAEGRILEFWDEDNSIIGAEVEDFSGKPHTILIAIDMSGAGLLISGNLTQRQCRMYASGPLLLLCYRASQAGSQYRRDLDRWANIAFDPNQGGLDKSLFEFIEYLFEEARDDDSEFDDDEYYDDDDGYYEEDLDEDDEDDMPPSKVISRKRAPFPKPGAQTGAVKPDEPAKQGVRVKRNGQDSEIAPGRQGKPHSNGIAKAAAAPPPEWWREFLQEKNAERRRHILTVAITQRLGLKKPDKWLIGDAIYRLNPQGTPLEILERFDSVLDTIGRTMPASHGKANAADPRLAAFLNSPEMAGARQSIEDEQTANYLMTWLEASPSSAVSAKANPVSIELVWHLAPRSQGFSELRWQLLITSARKHREPCSFPAISSLASDLSSGKRVAPPAQIQLALWLVNSPQTRDYRYEYEYDYRSQSAPESGGPTYPVVNARLWHSLWGRERLIHWESGEEAVFDFNAARLFVQAPQGQPPQWVVGIPQPDGAARHLPIAACEIAFESRYEGNGQHARQNIYLLESGTLRPLSCAGMPPDLLERLHARPVIPVDKLRNSNAAIALVKRYAQPAQPLSAAGASPDSPASASSSRPMPDTSSPTDSPAGASETETRGEEGGPSGALTDTAVQTSSGLMEFVRLAPFVECRYKDGMLYFHAAARARGDENGRIQFVRSAAGDWAAHSTKAVSTSYYASLPQEFSEPLQEVRSLLPDKADMRPGEAPAGMAPDATESHSPDTDIPHAFESAEAAARQADEAAPYTPNPWAICIAPHPKDVLCLDSFFDRLLASGTKFDFIEGGAARFKLKANRESLARLYDAWGFRPRGVKFLGDKAFAELVQLRRPPKFSLRIEPSGIDWLHVSVEIERDIEALKLSEVNAILKQESSELVVLTGGRIYRRNELEQFQKWMNALSDWGLDTAAGEQRLHVMQLAGTDNSRELLDLTDASGHDSLRALAGTARGLLKTFKGVPAANIAAETARWLRPYQRQGADFLVWALRVFGGAIMADDMGLGKTLQMLAALTALRSGNCADGESDADARLPSLVICPASVAHNWLREVAHFAPELRAAVLQSGEARRDMIQRADDYDLIITNYALARRDIEHIQRRRWLLACVDEAQMIKNPTTGIARAVKAIQARYRLALTGTPIENRLTDLWSIADFVAPGYLASRKKFESRMKEEDAERSFRSLRAKLRPLLMRRLKSEVAPELPPRIEERRDCEMTLPQRQTYLAAVKKTRLMLEGVDDENLRGPARIQMLAALMRLRQICCDPALAGFRDKGSGKLDATLEMIEELIEAGHKALLFSQFVKMLDILVPLLKKRGIPFWMLTGQTNTVKRHEIIADFESSKKPGVFLISLKAGGMGLNLVSASHVILFDPWWNPAVEAQAIDRTHRIGQDKTVVAFRMVTEGTVEERVLELQEKKRGLIKNVLEEEAFNRVLSREDFKYLLEE